MITPLKRSLVLLLACSSIRAAELIDPAAFGFGRPGYMVDASWVGGQDFSGNLIGSFDTFELRTIAPVGTMKIGEGGRLGFSLGYNWTNLDFDAGARYDLHTLEAQLAYFWNSPSTPWWGLGFVTPGLATDFEGISGDDFQIAALGLLGYEFTETFTVAGGVFASYANQDGMVLPALGFIWQPGDWNVQVTPPFVVLGRKLTDDVTVSLSLYPSGGSWDLDDPNQQNTLKVSGWQGAASVIWKVRDRLTISVRGGINFAGELEIRDNSEQVRVDENLDPAPFGALNVRWEF